MTALRFWTGGGHSWLHSEGWGKENRERERVCGGRGGQTENRKREPEREKENRQTDKGNGEIQRESGMEGGGVGVGVRDI